VPVHPDSADRNCLCPTYSRCRRSSGLSGIELWSMACRSWGVLPPVHWLEPTSCVHLARPPTRLRRHVCRRTGDLQLPIASALRSRPHVLGRQLGEWLSEHRSGELISCATHPGAPPPLICLTATPASCGASRMLALHHMITLHQWRVMSVASAGH
jgi:hypothetical protein